MLVPSLIVIIVGSIWFSYEQYIKYVKAYNKAVEEYESEYEILDHYFMKQERIKEGEEILNRIPEEII